MADSQKKSPSRRQPSTMALSAAAARRKARHKEKKRKKKEQKEKEDRFLPENLKQVVMVLGPPFSGKKSHTTRLAERLGFQVITPRDEFETVLSRSPTPSPPGSPGSATEDNSMLGAYSKAELSMLGEISKLETPDKENKDAFRMLLGMDKPSTLLSPKKKSGTVYSTILGDISGLPMANPAEQSAQSQAASTLLGNMDGVKKVDSEAPSNKDEVANVLFGDTENLAKVKSEPPAQPTIPEAATDEERETNSGINSGAAPDLEDAGANLADTENAQQAQEEVAGEVAEPPAVDDGVTEEEPERQPTPTDAPEVEDAQATETEGQPADSEPAAVPVEESTVAEGEIQAESSRVGEPRSDIVADEQVDEAPVTEELEPSSETIGNAENILLGDVPDGIQLPTSAPVDDPALQAMLGIENSAEVTESEDQREQRLAREAELRREEESIVEMEEMKELALKKLTRYNSMMAQANQSHVIEKRRRAEVRAKRKLAEKNMDKLRKMIETARSSTVFILGFPESVEEAQIFEEQIHEFDFILCFQAPEEQLRDRMQKQYQKDKKKLPSEEECNAMWENYNDNIKPVISEYQKLNKVRVVYNDGSMDDAHKEALQFFLDDDAVDDELQGNLIHRQLGGIIHETKRTRGYNMILDDIVAKMKKDKPRKPLDYLVEHIGDVKLDDIKHDKAEVYMDEKCKRSLRNMFAHVKTGPMADPIRRMIGFIRPKNLGVLSAEQEAELRDKELASYGLVVN